MEESNDQRPIRHEGGNTAIVIAGVIVKTRTPGILAVSPVVDSAS